MEHNMAFEERFWSKVNKDGDCWEWTAAKNNLGYGLFNHEYSSLAHRISWLLNNGEIPKDICVCHHCDNPSCVNPEHLFLGTNADNMRDMSEKGRAIRPRGEEHYRCKLTDKDVSNIRSRYAFSKETYAIIAREYGTSGEQISNIIKHKSRSKQIYCRRI